MILWTIGESVFSGAMAFIPAALECLKPGAIDSFLIAVKKGLNKNDYRSR